MAALHLFLSPHLDDAALSCGGLIRKLSAEGQTVRVLTLFAGRPGPALSPFAREAHRAWGDPADLLGLRRAEEAAALAILGAASQVLDELDALYREAPGGGWLYPSREALFAEIAPAERGWPEDLAALVAEPIQAAEEATLYAPLGVGHHVDHQLAHTAALLLHALGVEVRFYEEYPYAQRPGELDLALARARTHAHTHSAGAAAAPGWTPHLVALTPAQLAARIAAVGAYGSQLVQLFGGAEAMPGLLRAYAVAVGGGQPAERLWTP